jgi:TolB-like protein/Flp pilus assembly protein TadD
LDSAREYVFAGFTLDLHRGVLRDGSGAIDLRPKAFHLLACLVTNAGRVMPKEELLDAIWPDVTVSEDSLTQCIGELRRALGQAASAIKTVPRRGYVFEEAALEAVPAATTAEPPAAVANGRPSIAVMPFRNLSSDPEQDYFADGIVEDITAALGHFRQIMVISRNSAFSFKGLAIDSADVGRELGVRYLLQGSVRKSGEKLRLTAQLIEAESGVQLWSEQLDGVLIDIFAFQDEVARRVIGAIAPRVMHAELERSLRKRPESLDAYDLYLRAQASLRNMTREGNDLALSLVERALALEPGYAAMAGLGAWAYTVRAGRGWSAGSEEERQKGIALAARAMATGQEDAEALSLAGYAIGSLGAQLKEGIRAVDRAISLNPNSALALTNAGWLKTYLGLTEIATADFEQAKRLSPRDPGLYRLNTGLCCARILERDFNAAIEAGREAVMDNPNYVQAQRALAAALALSGQVEDARRVVENMLRLDASLTVGAYASKSALRFSGKFDQLLEGLRMAGLPE